MNTASKVEIPVKARTNDQFLSVIKSSALILLSTSALLFSILYGQLAAETIKERFPILTVQNIAESSISHEIEDNRRYDHSHFESIFAVEPLLTEMRFEPKYESFLTEYYKTHNITQEELYRKSPNHFVHVAALYAPYIQSGILRNDKRFYIKFASRDSGYGMFADVPIMKRKVVGIYTGVIGLPADSDYSWNLPVDTFVPKELVKDRYNDDKEKKSNENNTKEENDGMVKVRFGIDSKFAGNWLRFVNHSENPNCDIIYVPYENKWWVVYVSNRFIGRDEEVTVSYGSAYWKSRSLKKAPK